MMVGIDVTHAGPGSKDGTPSIAAVVASINDSFVQFPASLRIQKHAKNKEVCTALFETEIDRLNFFSFFQTLDELRDMLIERLEAYASHNKNELPERVLVFRDGVSEVRFHVPNICANAIMNGWFRVNSSFFSRTNWSKSLTHLRTFVRATGHYFPR